MSATPPVCGKPSTWNRSKMTEVRIRHDMDPDGHSLGDLPLSEIEDVVSLVKRWGISIPGDLDDADDFSGQFVYDKNSAYFEVVIHS